MLTEGSYIARARLGTLASRLTAFRVESAGTVSPIELVLEPCQDFTVHFVDAKGDALDLVIFRLGTDESVSFPRPCRVNQFCDNGNVALSAIQPGVYNAEFLPDRQAPFTCRLELRPDQPSVVVQAP